MLDEHWKDMICYRIYFKTEEGKKIYRSIILPVDFPEEKIPSFFSAHFKGRNIIVKEVDEIESVWLSKHLDDNF